MQMLKAKLQALKAKLQPLVRPKIFWPTIVILLIACTTLHILRVKEKALRMAAEKELGITIEEKRVVEINLAEAKKEILSRDEQIKLSLDKLEKEIVARKEVEVELVRVVKEKKDLETRIEELAVKLPKNIELEKIIIKTTSDLKGKVITYDKDNTFVLVDLGSENNLKLGDILSVYRDDVFMGKVQIEKVEDKISAAAVLSPWRNIEYKENDVVKKI